jgi:hypothetical protein
MSMYGTKVRAFACIAFATLFTCGVVVICLGSSWGHHAVPSSSRAEAASGPIAAPKHIAPTSKTEAPSSTVIVSNATAPPSAVIVSAPAATSEAAVVKNVEAAPPVSDSATSVAAKEDIEKPSDPLLPAGRSDPKKEATSEAKKDTEGSSGLVATPTEKASQNKDYAEKKTTATGEAVLGGAARPMQVDGGIKLASGTEPAAPVAGSTGPSPTLVVAPEPKSVKPALEDLKPVEQDKSIAPVAGNPIGLEAVKPVAATVPSPQAPVEATPSARPPTPDEELEKSRTDEKRLSDELTQKQTQLKELEGRHQEARGRLIKALASKVEAVTKEMETLQKELKERQKATERLTPAPLPEKTIEAPVPSTSKETKGPDKVGPSEAGPAPQPEKKSEDRITPTPSADKKGAERITPAPIPETKGEDRIIPTPIADKGGERAAPEPIADKKGEERIVPTPLSATGGVKEPPPAVEPSQGKTAPSSSGKSGKAKSKPKKEDADSAKPPVY